MVSHPRPTPVTADSTANTATKISERYRGGCQERHRLFCRSNPDQEGHRDSAVAFTAIATVIRMIPATLAALDGQLIMAGHQTHLSASCQHPAHQMDEDQ